jgi:hypothetical protein
LNQFLVLHHIIPLLAKHVDDLFLFLGRFIGGYLVYGLKPPCQGAGFYDYILLFSYRTKTVMSAKTTQFSTELRGQYKAKAYAADGAKSPLAPTLIPRRDPGENDVQIEILFCGICHTDLPYSP